MARVLKCRHCDAKDSEEKVKHVHTTSGGKSINMYFHLECYEEWLKEKEFKEKEQEELDKLVDVIMEVHDIDKIPHHFYPYIQDLRNGSVMLGKKRKKYKEGFEYDVIAQTYKSCKESIRYWKNAKDFGGTLGELKYCFAIINDKINIVKKRLDKKKHRQEIDKAKEAIEQQRKLETPSVNVEVKFKKQERKDDISRFLD